jgi:hypothetical protein
VSEPPSRRSTPGPARKPTPANLRKLTPSPARRSDARVPIALPIALRAGKRRLSLESADVGLGGLFLVTAEDLPLRQLVRIELVLPSDGRPFAAMGWLVHRLPEAGHPPGVGVQFYGLGKDEQRRWDAFVDRARAGGAAPPLLDVARLPRGALVPRRFTRDAAQSAVVRVEFPSDDDLKTALLRDVPRGAIFFLGDAELAVGDRVGLELVHTATGDVFELDGRVRRRVADDPVRGLEVKLALDDERRARFAEFVLDPLDPLDET